VIYLVNYGAHFFHSVIRKQQYSLLLSLVKSGNLLVKSVAESVRFLQSPLMSKWRTDLYTLYCILYLHVLTYFICFFGP